MLRKILDFANLTLSVLVGCYLVLLTTAATDGLKAVPAGLLESGGTRFLFFLVGILLVAGNIYALYEEWMLVGFRRNLRLTTDQGVNELSLPAMEMLILSDLKNEPDIVEPAVTLKPRGEGKPMLCVVELKIHRQKNVLKRLDAIKKEIRDIIDKLIPGGLTVEVVMEARDFVSESVRPSRNDSPEKEVFNGPVYADAGGGAESV